MALRLDLVDEAVRVMLEAATQKKWGLAELPDDTTLPYGILYPMTSPKGVGSFASPEEDRDLLYQTTSVGADPKQCRALASRVLVGFLMPAAGGGYEWPIAFAGGSVQWRASDMLGSILPSGVELSQVSDTFRLRVGA